jgi:hypothetical protein
MLGIRDLGLEPRSWSIDLNRQLPIAALGGNTTNEKSALVR